MYIISIIYIPVYIIIKKIGIIIILAIILTLWLFVRFQTVLLKRYLSGRSLANAYSAYAKYTATVHL